MSLRVDLYGPDHTGQERRPHVHERDGHSGLVVLSDPFRQHTQRVGPLVNENFGAAMNQAITFNSIKNVIYAGAGASAKTGTSDTNTPNKLDISLGGSGFNAAIEVGMTVENTVDSEYARISAVDSDTVLSLTTLGAPNGADLFPDGTDAFIINATWATSGASTWDFTTDISLLSGNDNDEAIFDADLKDLKTVSDLVALSFTITLVTFNVAQHNMRIQLREGGVLVGDEVLLSDYIDTGDFTAQNVVIPMVDFNLGTPTITGLSLVVQRGGGSKPSWDIDDIILETGSTPLSYRIVATPGKRFRVSHLVFTFVDALNIDRVNASAPVLSYDKILGDSSLANGIVFNWVREGISRLSLTFREIGDFMKAGAVLQNVISDGTNTSIQLVVTVPEPLILEGSPDANYIEAVIQDDLSTLVAVNIFARGGEESI